MTPRARRRWPLAAALLLGGLGALLGTVGGCLSPTLPLPPPDEPAVSSAGQGLVLLEGTVPEPGVPVIAVNDDTRTYAGEDADPAGRYSFVIAAESGHHLRLWYVLGTERSSDRPFEIPTFGLDALSELTVLPPDADGLVRMTGVAPEPLAEVYVMNRTSGTVVHTPADDEGAFLLEITGASGEALELWYTFGQEPSPATLVVVPAQ